MLVYKDHKQVAMPAFVKDNTPRTTHDVKEYAQTQF